MYTPLNPHLQSLSPGQQRVIQGGVRNLPVFETQWVVAFEDDES